MRGAYLRSNGICAFNQALNGHRIGICLDALGVAEAFNTRATQQGYHCFHVGGQHLLTSAFGQKLQRVPVEVRKGTPSVSEQGPRLIDACIKQSEGEQQDQRHARLAIAES